MIFSKQNGFFNLSNLILLGLVVAGLGFMYWKGYRLDIQTKSGAGEEGAGGQPGGIYYTVQISVTPNEAKAKDLVHALDRDGYDAYYDTYESPRGRQYKVRIGQYQDQQTASAVKTQVRQRYQKLKDSFVKYVNE